MKNPQQNSTKLNSAIHIKTSTSQPGMIYSRNTRLAQHLDISEYNLPCEQL